MHTCDFWKLRARRATTIHARRTFPRDPLVSACLACACAGPPLPLPLPPSPSPSPLPPPRAVRPFVRLWIRAPHQTVPYRTVLYRAAPLCAAPYRRAAPRPNLNSASRDPDVVSRTLPLPTSAARRQPLARVSIAPIVPPASRRGNRARIHSRPFSPYLSFSLPCRRARSIELSLFGARAITAAACPRDKSDLRVADDAPT